MKMWCLVCEGVMKVKGVCLSTPQCPSLFPSHPTLPLSPTLPSLSLPPSLLYRRLVCLKYLVLANMLTKSSVNPFDSQEVSAHTHYNPPSCPSPSCPTNIGDHSSPGQTLQEQSRDQSHDQFDQCISK